MLNSECGGILSWGGILGESAHEKKKNRRDGHGHKSFARDFFLLFSYALFPDSRKIYCQCHLGFFSPFLCSPGENSFLFQSGLLSSKEILPWVEGRQSLKVLLGIAECWFEQSPAKPATEKVGQTLDRNLEGGGGIGCPGAEKDKNKIMINEGTLMVTFNDFSFSGLQLCECAWVTWAWT